VGRIREDSFNVYANGWRFREVPSAEEGRR
jgi:hypothetical protein